MVIAQTCVRAVATVEIDVSSVGTVWTYVHSVGPVICTDGSCVQKKEFVISVPNGSKRLETVMSSHTS